MNYEVNADTSIQVIYTKIVMFAKISTYDVWL